MSSVKNFNGNKNKCGDLRHSNFLSKSYVRHLIILIFNKISGSNFGWKL